MADTKLQEWISAHLVTDEMLWKGAWGRQVEFVRDALCYLVASGLSPDDEDDYKKFLAIPDVISTHRSKSIELPVYELSRPDLGIRFILRNNFYNWKLSVLSEMPIIADFSGLFHTTPPVEPKYTGNELSPVYFEGFPDDLIFGYYESSDKLRWSAEIQGDHNLYTAIFLTMRAIGAVKPFVWLTEASHDAEIKERQKKREAKK